MDNNNYIQQRQNRKKQWLRIRLGILQMIHRPLLSILLIPLVTITVLLQVKKEIAFSLFNVPRFFSPIYEYAVNMMAVLLPFLLLVGLIDMVGDITARKDEADLQKAFTPQELRNGCPVLMDKKRIKGNKVTMREFYSDIPMKVWIERKEAIETCMNCHFIGELQYGGKADGRRIVMHTAQGIKRLSRGDLYDEEL